MKAKYPVKFELRVVCPECGWHGNAHGLDNGWSAMLWWHDSICPSCGTIKNNEFSVRSMVWKSPFPAIVPLSLFIGKWEFTK